MIRVALVDDHHIVRQGIQSYLNAAPDIDVIGTAESGETFLTQVSSLVPDVGVMDLYMPGGIDGIETTRRARQVSPNTQIVVLTAHTDDERVIAALRVGAVGYVRKESDPQLLLEAIRAANQGHSVIDPGIANVVLEDLSKPPLPGTQLTEREQEVLRELAHGLSNQEIADKLVVSPETIKTHVGNVLAKLHLKHRHQAVIYALKAGLLSLNELDI